MWIGDKWITLKALQTFEAAARHGHMGKAAKELQVTDSAVSYQVRALEESLGAPLFKRNGPKISITMAGEKLSKAVGDAFADIRAVALHLDDLNSARDMTIAAYPNIIKCYLLDLIPPFLNRYPELNIKVISLRDGDEIPSNYDLMLAWESSDHPGKKVLQLATVDLFPVCSVDYFSGAAKLSKELLSDLTLIHEDDGLAWARWLSFVGLEGVKPKRNIYASQTLLGLDLAKQGCGVALADELIMQSRETSPNLMRPFKETMPAFGSYYIITPITPAPPAVVQEFQRVLVEAMGQSL